MASPRVGNTQGQKGVGSWMMARVLDHDGTNLLPTKVATMTVTITKPNGNKGYDDHDVITGEGEASEFIESALQGGLGDPDPRWKLNDVDGDEAELGYNFSHYIPGAQFPDVGTYKIDYVITRGTDATPASEEIIRVSFSHTVISGEGTGTPS